MSTLSYGTSKFPYQKRSTRSKDKEFCKECLEAALVMGDFYSQAEDKRYIKINEDLYNGSLNKDDMEKELNPYGIQGEFFPESMQCYPLIKNKIDLLIGEEWKRRFEWNVVVVNPDAISQKQEKLRERLNEFIIEKLMQEEFDKQKVEEEIKKLDKWRRYSFKDIRELRGSEYLNYLFRKLELKRKFNEGFKDLIVKRGEIFCIDVVAKEPIVRRVERENITVMRSGNSPYIDDADIIIEDSYQSPGWIIDHFYEDLSDSQIKNISEGLPMKDGQTEDGLINYTDGSHGYTFPTTNLDYTIDTNAISMPGTKGYIDDQGNIRVVRVVWKSLRKVGKITWIDDDGEEMEKIVDENYTPSKELGEEVKWLWINEWWENTRIGKDIYLKYGPRPIQFRRKGNISAAGSGYVGVITDVCMIDIMKPFQYMYDIFMHRTKLAFAKSYGKILDLDLARVPDGWSIEKWLYYVKTMNLHVGDSFNEGKKGTATGKLAGAMNQNSRVIDMEMGNYINQHLQMLQYIEYKVGDIAGITKQREGNITSTETVGGVERSVTQSSHITEPWYALHEGVKERVLETLLETAKYAWRGRKEPVQFIASDMSTILSELDGDLFNEAEFGLDISSTSEDNELARAYKDLAHAAIQNDKMSFSTLGAIFASPSMSDIRKKIETEEEDARERQQQQQQQQLELQERMIQAQLESSQADRDLRKYEIDTKASVDLQIASMRQQEDGKGADPISLEKIKLDWEKMEREYQLKREQNKIKQDEQSLKKKQLSEVERHNKETEKIAKSKPKSNR